MHGQEGLIKEQDDIDKIYLYAKDLSELEYGFLIKKREDAGTKHFSEPNAFIECSNTMNDVYENMDDYVCEDVTSSELSDKLPLQRC